MEKKRKCTRHSIIAGDDTLMEIGLIEAIVKGQQVSKAKVAADRIIKSAN